MRRVCVFAIIATMLAVAGCASSGDFKPHLTKYSNWDELQGSAQGSR